MSLHGRNIVAGEYSNSGGAAFNAFSPVEDTILEPAFTEASEEEINQAVASADRDFDDIRNAGPEKRSAFLRAIAENIMELGNHLVNRAMDETGLPEARITGERARTVNQLKLFSEVVEQGHHLAPRIDTADPQRTPVPKPDLRMVNIPIGPVAVFGASNFPLAFSVAGGDTASALAAGCPVIVKAHPGHPGTSELVGEAIRAAARETGIPAGVFSLLHGKSTAVGQSLVRHPLLRAVAFTGSHGGGRALFDLAASRPYPIPCFAEMGSVNPVFLLPEQLGERAETIATQYIDSVNLGVGQFCTNPGLVFGIQGSALDRFIEAAAQKVRGIGAGTMLHPGIQEGYIHALNKSMGLKGIELIAEGTSGHGCTAQSSLLKAMAPDFIKNAEMQEEIFGPASMVVVCADDTLLLEAAATLQGNLTATLHATPSELHRYRALITLLEKKVGRLIFNGFPTGVEVCHAMMHGGPYPATTDSRFTSVGTRAIERFLRPVCYQNFPKDQLPGPLKDKNPSDLLRMVNGSVTTSDIETGQDPEQ